MCARIFYGSYNAVAMHRVVMCKSSGDKHIDSSAWAGSGSRRCFTEMMGLALQGAAWLQGCLSPAQGMGHRLSSHPHRLSCGQCKEQSKVPLASQLGHKCHSRSRSCSKGEIIFHCHITKSVLQRWNLTHRFTLDFDVIRGHWCEGRDAPSAGWASERHNCILPWVPLIAIKWVKLKTEICIQLYLSNISPSLQTDT